jgi:NAD(P)-dependent dehydrogenase (short-subunit alcohol dehydrogenase family)
VGGTFGSAYYASKHGVVGLTKAAAIEYGNVGIRVNAVCPGVIQTEMADRLIQDNKQRERAVTALHPLGRLGTPDEIAQAVVWLSSDAASFVTGQAIAVDGGYVAQ